MLTSLISFDGVFFGFSAIVFSSLVGRESSYERISYIFTAMIATVILFVLSVVFAFLGLASVESRGLSECLRQASWVHSLRDNSLLFHDLHPCFEEPTGLQVGKSSRKSPASTIFCQTGISIRAPGI